MEDFEGVFEEEGNEIKQEFEDDIQEAKDIANDFEKIGLEDAAKQDWTDSKTYTDYIPKHSMYANFLELGLPYLVLTIIGVIWNIYANMKLNKEWAGGSIWLITNTIYTFA